MKISSFFRIVLLSTLGFLSLGTVAKRKDPILMTQTDPIDYREKQKEEREGKKGPPAPAINLFPQQRFLITPPVAKPKIIPEEKKRSQAEEYWMDEEEDRGQGEDEFKLELEKDDTWEYLEEDEKGD